MVMLPREARGRKESDVSNMVVGHMCGGLDCRNAEWNLADVPADIGATVWVYFGRMAPPAGDIGTAVAVDPNGVVVRRRIVDVSVESPAGTDPREDGSGDALIGRVTHYGESYNGRQMGCEGSGLYDSEDPSIVAVGPSAYAAWPCGTVFRVCGEGGCIHAIRSDSCPGCGQGHLDLSERGIAIVCGEEVGTCEVSIEVVK